MGCRCCKCCKGEEEEGMKDINRSRSCTDVLCLVILLVFIASLVILAIVGAVSGNAESLFYGTDSTGNTCGSPNLNVAEADRVDMTNKVR